MIEGSFAIKVHGSAVAEGFLFPHPQGRSLPRSLLPPAAAQQDPWWLLRCHFRNTLLCVCELSVRKASQEWEAVIAPLTSSVVQEQGQWELCSPHTAPAGEACSRLAGSPCPGCSSQEHSQSTWETRGLTVTENPSHRSSENVQVLIFTYLSALFSPSVTASFLAFSKDKALDLRPSLTPYPTSSWYDPSCSTSSDFRGLDTCRCCAFPSLVTCSWLFVPQQGQCLGHQQAP